ncbi:MAG: acetyl-CoA carboxylase carboxyltransferase subunit beta [Methylocystaceae bacterium]
MFNKSKRKYIEIPVSRPPKVNRVPSVLDICPVCGNPLSEDVSWENLCECSNCHYREPMGAWQRIDLVADPDSFQETNSELIGKDWLEFPGYQEKLQIAREKSGLAEAIVTGKCTIDGNRTVLAVMDTKFMMASMGTAVGEKLLQAMQLAKIERLPLVVFAASGGARMQEGLFALLQMSRTSAAVEELNEARQLFIVVLTDPTTGGVIASFASLADIIIAEKGAKIGFAGPRVITQTTGEKLPDDFQRAETLLKQGMVDLVLEREEIRDNLAWLLQMHRGGGLIG